MATLAVVMLFTSASSNNERSGIVGTSAADFTVGNYNGVVSLSQFRGKYVLLSLWSSTDVVSRLDNIRCDRFAAASQSVELLSVNFDRSKALFNELVAADGLDAIPFGNVFHRAAELLYRQLTSAGAVVRGEDIDFFLEMDGQRLEPFVRQAFREEFFKGMPEEYRGILYIARRVVNTYLMQLLRHDRRLTPITILGLEVRQTTTLRIAGMEIDTGGIIDRLDLVADDQVAGGQAIRVVDYKTGGRPEAVATLDQLFQDTDQKAHYAFQTILYAAIVAEARRQPVTPALFYVHRSGAETYTPKLRLCGQLIHDVGAPAGRDAAETLSAEFTERLERLIARIFDPAEPFRQTDNLRSCEHCDFRQLCRR